MKEVKTISGEQQNEKKEYPVLEPGIYTVAYNKGVVREMKNGQGKYFNAEFDLVSEREDLKDRKVWKMFTLTHEGNPEYAEWGANALRSFLNAGGVIGGLEEIGFDPENFSEDKLEPLKGKKVNVELKVQPAKGQYKAQNQIKKFMKMN